MAELRSRPGAISKGMKLPVTIEDAIEDVLVVCLEYGAKLFKGILLDINKRNLPHGVCVPFSANGNGSKDDPGASGVNNNADQDIEISATNFRHTYLRGNEEHVNNFILRSSKDRPARSIRLRPRSTLCSKCKSVCQETEKGIMPVQQIVKQNNQKNQAPQQSLREGLRRRSVQSKEPQNTKSTDSNKNSVVTRSSPFIKISFGEGTVLKIPPRLHDEVDGTTVKSKGKAESVKEESPTEQDKNRRTSKRNLRKTKDRAKRMEDEPKKESESSNENVTSHHKKHKRKHKHKHGENEDKNQNPPSEGVDENLESTTENQSDAAQRPRLLYTWRQNKGLSPRRENTTNNIENVNKNISLKQNLQEEISPKRNVRIKSSDQVQKKEYKLRSRERLSIDSVEKVEKSPRKEEEKTPEEEAPDEDFDNDENVPELVMTVSEESMPDIDSASQEMDRDIVDSLDSKEKSPVYYNSVSDKSTDYYLNSNHDYFVTLNSTNSLSNSITSSRSENHDKYVIIDTDKYSVISSASEREFDFKDEDIPLSPERTSSPLPMVSPPSHQLDPVSPVHHQPHPISLVHEPALVSQQHHYEPVEIPAVEEEEEEEEKEDIADAPPTNNDDVFKSLMMKIRTRDVPKCMATDGRTIRVGDIVWGKIKGFPWWPGRVLSISVSERDGGIVIRKLAHVSWFGSSTMSHIQCSDLYPFLEDFKLRYNRKKRGPYKVAIKQATIAAQSVTNTHHIDFKEFDL